MNNEVLTCSAGATTYSIIPFGPYYGLYAHLDFPKNTEFSSKHTGYIIRYYKPDGVQHPIGCALASAIGLPEEAQFESIEDCKKFVSETCSAVVIWEIRKDEDESI